jgi:hypothetical protein
MNVFELATLIFIVGMTWLLASNFYKHYGVAGAGIGILLAFLLLLLLRKIIGFALMRIDDWRPPRPICKKGKCNYEDYTLVEIRPDVSIHFRCSCGDNYIQKEGIFLELQENGTTRPYMRRNGKIFGKWVHATEQTGTIEIATPDKAGKDQL